MQSIPFCGTAFSKNRQKLSILAGAILLAMTGCQTVEKTVKKTADFATDTVIGQHLQPTIIAAAEEHCVATEIILEELGYSTGFGSNLFVSGAVGQLAKLASSDENSAMFCKQNVVGAAAVTDKALQLMLGEVGNGLTVASEALGEKDADVRATLLAVQQLQGKSISAYSGDRIDTTVEQINKVSARLQAEIDARIEAGGLSEESKQLMVKAAEHLRGASYYRGKALVGVKVILLNLEKEGAENHLASALVSKGKSDSAVAIKQLATGGLNFLRGTGESIELTNNIHKLADAEGFEEALDEIRNPDPTAPTSLAVFAEAEAEANEDLDLPTFEENEDLKA